jgi:hypothetical protein
MHGDEELNNSMECSPSWEANSCSAIQSVHHQWFTTVFMTPTDSNISQFNPGHIPQPYFFNVHLIFFHIWLHLPNGLFSSGFQTNFLRISYHLHVCCMCFVCMTNILLLQVAQLCPWTQTCSTPRKHSFPRNERHDIGSKLVFSLKTN